MVAHASERAGEEPALSPWGDVSLWMIFRQGVRGGF